MKVKLIVLSLLYILSSLGLLQANDSVAEKKNVLVISSYSPIKENGTHLISTFTQELMQKIDAKISVEYMDCESTSTHEEWNNWMNQLFKAYKVNPDVVVLLGGEAWSAYKATCIDEWRNIPIVLGSVKKKEIDYKNKLGQKMRTLEESPQISDTFGDLKVTGYYLKDYLEENILLIKKLQPDIRYIALWYDNPYSLNFFKDYLLSIFAKIDSINLCYLSGDTLSTGQLLDTIAQMDDSHALLSAGWYTDVNKYPHASSMLQNELSRYTSKFVYLIQDQNLSNMNYIGGYYVAGKDVGSDLAILTGNLLTGGSTHIPPFQLTPSAPRYYINYPAFLKAGLNEKFLPEDTIFYNTRPSIVKEHPLEVAIALFLILSLLILFLVVFYIRKRKEESYKTANERMMQLLGSMPDMAVIYDSEQTIIEIINPQENVLLGFKRKDLIGMNMQNVGVRNPAFMEAAKLIVKNVIETQKTQKIIVFDYQVPDYNTIYYAHARTVPFGKHGAICFAHDVSPHVMAEKKIRKLQVFLKSIVDNLPIGLLVKDASDDFRYLFYNQKASDFYQDRSKDMIGKNDFEIGDPLAAKFREEDETVCKSSHPLSFERVYYDEEGEPCRWGIINKTRLINNDDSCYIISVIVDTTEIRKKEIELEESKFKLELAFDVAQIVLWEYHVNSCMFTSPNPAVFEHRGVSLEEIRTYMHPEDALLLETDIQNIADQKSNTLNLQARITYPGTEQRWFDIHASVYERDDKGNVTRIIGLRRDVTALKMTDELIELRNKAEEANRLKSAFLANMSHEIRTPLNAIIGFSNLIVQAENPEEATEFCQIIETNNALLLQLINDILDLSKIEAGQIDFNYSPVNLSDMFKTLKQMFREKVYNGVELCCELPNSPITISSDKNRITQVLTNFLTNACKFTSEGSIRMGYKDTGNGLYFFVVDTGKGIAPENVPNVFQRFSKFDSFVQGTGLGLSISESIVQHLGGRIGVESEIDKGSLFWFSLPNSIILS